MRVHLITGVTICIAAGLAACHGSVGQEDEKPAPQLAVVSGTTLSPVTPGVPYAESTKAPDKGARL